MGPAPSRLLISPQRRPHPCRHCRHSSAKNSSNSTDLFGFGSGLPQAGHIELSRVIPTAGARQHPIHGGAQCLEPKQQVGGSGRDDRPAQLAAHSRSATTPCTVHMPAATCRVQGSCLSCNHWCYYCDAITATVTITVAVMIAEALPQLQFDSRPLHPTAASSLRWCLARWRACT